MEKHVHDPQFKPETRVPRGAPARAYLGRVSCQLVTAVLVGVRLAEVGQVVGDVLCVFLLLTAPSASRERQLNPQI